MTEYDATYVKNFTETCSNYLVTAKTKIAQIIDDGWLYSRQWADDYGWIDQAKKDLGHETKDTKDRLSELKQAREMLNSIIQEEKI